MSSGSRQGVGTSTTTTELQKAKDNWNKAARGELHFDFTPAEVAEEKKPGPDWGSRDRIGVKEAIIRWLEEQL